MKIKGLPTNVEEFKLMRDEVAKTPEGGAAMFIIALKIYSGHPSEGLKCLIVQREINDLHVSGGEDSYSGYAMPGCELSLIKTQLCRQPYIPDSYFVGTSPENDYKINEGDLQFDITTNPYSGDPSTGKVKVFVRSSGADTARPVQMQRNTKGIWKVKELTSLIVGIRETANDTRQASL